MRAARRDIHEFEVPIRGRRRRDDAGAKTLASPRASTRTPCGLATPSIDHATRQCFGWRANRNTASWRGRIPADIRAQLQLLHIREPQVEE